MGRAEVADIRGYRDCWCRFGRFLVFIRRGRRGCEWRIRRVFCFLFRVGRGVGRVG